VTRLLFEIMVFTSFESESPTLTITNAAGVVTFADDETGAQIQASDGLPEREQSLFTQVERYLESRFGDISYCDCGSHPEWLSLTYKKTYFSVIPGTGLDRNCVQIICHGLWPEELTPEVRKAIRSLRGLSPIKFTPSEDGMTMHIDVPCAVFVGQNIDLAFSELLSTRKQLKKIYKSQGEKQ
jgi:hypothetical protein